MNGATCVLNVCGWRIGSGVFDVLFLYVRLLVFVGVAIDKGDELGIHLLQMIHYCIFCGLDRIGSGLGGRDFGLGDFCENVASGGENGVSARFHLHSLPNGLSGGL